MNWLNLNPMMMGMGPGRLFSVSLKAYSAPFYERADAQKINEINYGGKILLPSSALDSLVRLNIQYPMLFSLRNHQNGHTTNAGVLEFSAQEGRAYLPLWMMNQLGLTEGALIQVETATLPKATYAKLKPTSVDFLQISNPRAVLEMELRKYACLTVNDRIAIQYNDQLLEFKVLELKPGDAVLIIECDVNLEFDAPDGYVDEEQKRMNEKTLKPPAPLPEIEEAPVTTTFKPFQSSGARLDGKIRKNRTESSCSLAGSVAPDSIPALGPVIPKEDYVPGSITFPRYDYKARVVIEKENEEKQKGSSSSGPRIAFSGSGNTLRDRK